MNDIDIIEISEDVAQLAKNDASFMSNPQQRKRSMIDMIGINCAINYLQSKKIKISTNSSIYKIPSIFEEFKISDIYCGNYRIDVITLYKEKSVKIPKVHLDYDILPNFYFIVQIGSKIKEAKMIGFINSKSVTSAPSDSKYIYPELDYLFGIEKFRNLTKYPFVSKAFLGKHSDCVGLFLKFIDNDLSNVYKSQFIRHLMNCESCRNRFIETMEFEGISKNISQFPKIINGYDPDNYDDNSKENNNKNILNDFVEAGYEEPEETQLQKVETIEEQNKNTSIIEEIDNALQNNELFKDVTENNEENIIQEEEKEQTKASIEDISSTQAKTVLDTIFQGAKKIDIPAINSIIGSKHKYKIIASVVLVSLILIITIIASKNVEGIENIDTLERNPQELAEFENNSNQNSFEGMDDDYYDDYALDRQDDNHKARLIPKQRSVDEFAINQPISTKPVYTPTVNKVAWEVPQSLVKKPNYTKFLQLTGKNIKLNLQNDLLLVNDVPINKSATVVIKIASSGDVTGLYLTQTSGSRAIDSSIVKVIKDTLKYMKPPSHGIIARPVEASLTIELK